MKLDTVSYNKAEVMARPESPHVTNTGQDTAAPTVPGQPEATHPAPTDERSRDLFPSALNKQILGNPVLYLGRADF